MKEGEAKHAAQIEAERLRHQVEHLYTRLLSAAAECRRLHADLQATGEELHVHISRARARGEVRAKHDLVYRLYRDKVMLDPGFDREEFLASMFPDDRKQMAAILDEDRHGEACVAVSVEKSRIGWLKQGWRSTGEHLASTEYWAIAGEKKP